MSELTLARLKKLLKYNRRTGVFTNRINRGTRAVKGAITGCVRADGYLDIVIDGKNYLAHRLAWLYIHGGWPVNDLDHKNGVRDDNRIKKLRPATRAINGKNQKLHRNSKTGVCGVHLNKARGKYCAQIMVNGKQKHLGLYNEFEEATKVRRAAEKELGYHPNHGLTAKQRAKK